MVRSILVPPIATVLAQTYHVTKAFKITGAVMLVLTAAMLIPYAIGKAAARVTPAKKEKPSIAVLVGTILSLLTIPLLFGVVFGGAGF